MVVYSAYNTCQKQFKLWKVPTMAGSIVVVGALTCFALASLSVWKLHRLMCNIISFKNLWLTSSNRAITLQKQPKTFVVQKVRATFYYSTVTRWFKKFCLGCKNLDNQAWSDRPKSIDSKALLKTIENSTWRVSGELGISQPRIIHHFHILCKSIQKTWIVLLIAKILQKFWLTLINQL